MHSILVCKDPKTILFLFSKNIVKKLQKMSFFVLLFFTISDTLFNQKSPDLLVPVIDKGYTHSVHCTQHTKLYGHCDYTLVIETNKTGRFVFLSPGQNTAYIKKQQLENQTPYKTFVDCLSRI